MSDDKYPNVFRVLGGPDLSGLTAERQRRPKEAPPTVETGQRMAGSLGLEANVSGPMSAVSAGLFGTSGLVDMANVRSAETAEPAKQRRQLHRVENGVDEILEIFNRAGGS